MSPDAIVRVIGWVSPTFAGRRLFVLWAWTKPNAWWRGTFDVAVKRVAW